MRRLLEVPVDAAVTKVKTIHHMSGGKNEWLRARVRLGRLRPFGRGCWLSCGLSALEIGL
jgi:hypothetical protein